MPLKMCDAVRLTLTTHLSDRDIAAALSLSKTTVGRYRRIAFQAGYRWEELRHLSPDALRRRFNRSRRGLTASVLPDFAAIQSDLERDACLTLRFVWEKYRAQRCGTGSPALSYSQFTHHFRRHAERTTFSMRQRHIAGDAAYLDFSGKRPFYTDPATGDHVSVELFVAVLGASGYTFATCVPTQRIADWTHANVAMLEFFGGVPQRLVPDNLKAAVLKAGPDPTLQKNYDDLARHYEVAIVPARPRKPKDKALVENAVKLLQRWLLPALRRETHFSLDALNARAAQLLAWFNDRPMRCHNNQSRRQRFDTTDKPVLRALPPAPYVYAEWTGPQKVPRDYHVPVHGHAYSVPHQLVGQAIEARVLRQTVEFYVNHALVATHTRSQERGDHTTLPEHQAPEHRAYAGRTVDALRSWAKRVGTSTERLVEAQFAQRVPALGLPTCQAFKRLAEQHGERAFESAAARAVFLGSLTLTAVKSVLRNGLHEDPRATAPAPHRHLRGPTYYANPRRTPC